MSMIGVNSYQMSGVGVNFQGNSSKPVTETSKKDKKFSTGSKIGLGAAAVATLVVASIAIKNKSAANALKKAANEVGLNVETYKNLKSEGFRFSKADNIGYEDVFAKVKELYKNKQLKNGDDLCLLRDTKGLSEAYKQEGKIVNFPENTLVFSIKRGDDCLHKECIVYDKMCESLEDLFNGKGVFTQKIKID